MAENENQFSQEDVSQKQTDYKYNESQSILDANEQDIQIQGNIEEKFQTMEQNIDKKQIVKKKIDMKLDMQVIADRIKANVEKKRQEQLIEQQKIQQKYDEIQLIRQMAAKNLKKKRRAKLKKEQKEKLLEKMKVGLKNKFGRLQNSGGKDSQQKLNPLNQTNNNVTDGAINDQLQKLKADAELDQQSSSSSSSSSSNITNANKQKKIKDHIKREDQSGVPASKLISSRINNQKKQPTVPKFDVKILANLTQQQQIKLLDRHNLIEKQFFDWDSDEEAKEIKKGTAPPIQLRLRRKITKAEKIVHTYSKKQKLPPNLKKVMREEEVRNVLAQKAHETSLLQEFKQKQLFKKQKMLSKNSSKVVQSNNNDKKDEYLPEQSTLQQIQNSMALPLTSVPPQQSIPQCLKTYTQETNIPLVDNLVGNSQDGSLSSNAMQLLTKCENRISYFERKFDANLLKKEKELRMRNLIPNSVPRIYSLLQDSTNENDCKLQDTIIPEVKYVDGDIVLNKSASIQKLQQQQLNANTQQNHFSYDSSDSDQNDNNEEKDKSQQSSQRNQLMQQYNEKKVNKVRRILKKLKFEDPPSLHSTDSEQENFRVDRITAPSFRNDVQQKVFDQMQLYKDKIIQYNQASNVNKNNNQNTLKDMPDSTLPTHILQHLVKQSHNLIELNPDTDMHYGFDGQLFKNLIYNNLMEPSERLPKNWRMLSKGLLDESLQHQACLKELIKTNLKNDRAKAKDDQLQSVRIYDAFFKKENEAKIQSILDYERNTEVQRLIREEQYKLLQKQKRIQNQKAKLLQFGINKQTNNQQQNSTNNNNNQNQFQLTTEQSGKYSMAGNKLAGRSRTVQDRRNAATLYNDVMVRQQMLKLQAAQSNDPKHKYKDIIKFNNETEKNTSLLIAPKFKVNIFKPKRQAVNDNDIIESIENRPNPSSNDTSFNSQNEADKKQKMIREEQRKRTPGMDAIRRQLETTISRLSEKDPVKRIKNHIEYIEQQSKVHISNGSIRLPSISKLNMQDMKRQQRAKQLKQLENMSAKRAATVHASAILSRNATNNNTSLNVVNNTSLNLNLNGIDHNQKSSLGKSKQHIVYQSMQQLLPQHQVTLTTNCNTLQNTTLPNASEQTTYRNRSKTVESAGMTSTYRSQSMQIKEQQELSDQQKDQQPNQQNQHAIQFQLSQNLNKMWNKNKNMKQKYQLVQNDYQEMLELHNAKIQMTNRSRGKVDADLPSTILDLKQLEMEQLNEGRMKKLTKPRYGHRVTKEAYKQMLQEVKNREQNQKQKKKILSFVNMIDGIQNTSLLDKTVYDNAAELLTIQVANKQSQYTAKNDYRKSELYHMIENQTNKYVKFNRHTIQPKILF